MALAVQNNTYQNITPGASSQTWQHTHPAGSNGMLVVIISMSNSTNFSSMTYGGVNMTLEGSFLYSGQSARTAIFSLANPPVGTSQNLVATYTGAQWNPTSLWAQSWTGAAPVIGNFASSGLTSTPHSRTLNVSAGSAMMVAGISSAAVSSISINGSNRTIRYQHNINSQTYGARAVGLPAGNIDATITVGFGSTTNVRVEVKEFASTPTGKVEGSWIMLL